VKTVTMTMRGCPKPVHEALKKSAKANRRSLNKETLAWLEKQAAREEAERPVTGREMARILRELDKGLTAEDRRQIAEGIEEARRRMAREHLH
jgi:predicted HicB family RNase H-like nuclease